MTGKNILKLGMHYKRHSRVCYNNAKFKTQEALNKFSQITFFANSYIIPKNDYIRDKMLSLKQYQVVKISGYLVHILTPRGTLKLSTDFNDTSRCKYMYVEDIEVIKNII